MSKIIWHCQLAILKLPALTSPVEAFLDIDAFLATTDRLRSCFKGEYLKMPFHKVIHLF